MTTLTPYEADEFLREVRTNREVDDPERLSSDNVQDLNRSLDLLAEQLYSKPTHFLLELIQNADDNTFAYKIPTLSFTTDIPGRPLGMRIDCNEVGFTEENVKAICGIGRSTKVEERKKGFIGEKGIGFKSAFKVANTVHISSGPFQFKFDRRKALGMIAPIIEQFPRAQIVGGQTQMLLKLKSQAELTHINDELQSIKRHLLIFLRRLLRITIRTPSHHVQFEITRKTRDALSGGETAELVCSIFNERGKISKVSSLKYVIVRYTAQDLPEDERRIGISESEIVLAFPIDANTDPYISRQDVYAYLPIDDYGFAYLIHADFLLVASRESIATRADWNICLRQKVVEAFREAVHRFTTITSPSPSSGLRYTWPEFLGHANHSTAKFWSQLQNDILRDLRTESILESRDETMSLCCPTDLSYIPKKFRHAGEPMLEDKKTRKYHLSFHYDARSPQEFLAQIGVKEMTESDFLKEFKGLINRRGVQFLKDQSSDWHVKVSKIFRDSFRRRQLKDLPVIPLRTGEWVSPSEECIFLGTKTINLAIPHGINIRLIDAEACEDEDRKAFFTWLGIRMCKREDVCDMIMERHALSDDFNITDCVADAMYLFNSPSSAYNDSIMKLHIVDNNLKVTRGKNLYVDHPDHSFTISNYATADGSGIRMIHQRYMLQAQKMGKESEFVRWLVQRLQVSTLPRLIRDGRVTKEFKFFTTKRAPELLILLRNNWDHYSKQIYEPITVSIISAPRTLMKELSEMIVLCVGEEYHPLGETVLPLPDLKTIGGSLPFLDIDDPGDERWLKFEALRVITEEGLELYLRQLKALASNRERHRVTTATVREIYRQIGARSTSKFHVIEQVNFKPEFDEHRLVFHAKEERWLFLRDCVWEAPPCLTKVFALAKEYKDCKSLFHDRLRLQNATIEHIVDELLGLPTPEMDRRKEILLVLNDYLGRGLSSSSIKKLRGQKIIPVAKYIRTGEDRVLMNYDKDIWYLADRPSLLGCFKKKVWLIDFPVEVVRRLSPLIKALSVEDYVLSKAVEETTECCGDTILDEDRTIDLRERVHFFTRLTSVTNHDDLAQLIVRLQSLTVWGVASIKLNRRIVDEDIEGAEDFGEIVFQETELTLKIFTSFDTDDLSTSDFILSEHFIKHCGITDTTYQKLVLPILTVPISKIEKLLESHNLDGEHHTGHKSDLPESLFTHFGDVDQSFNGAMVPYFGSRNALPTASDTLSAVRPSNLYVPSSLRARVPTLDEGLRVVREAVTLDDENSSFVVLGSHTYCRDRDAASEGGSESGTFEDSGIGDSALNGEDSSDGEDEDGHHQTDAFDVASLRLALPEAIESGSPRRASFRRRSPASFQSHSRSHREPNGNGVDGANSPRGINERLIGLHGEIFINEYFSKRLEDWTESNWTSKCRVEAGLPSFNKKEKDFSDFTYQDCTAALTRIFISKGLKIPELWLQNFENPPTYHLEVKSTTEKSTEPFYMSNNQVEMARHYRIRSSNRIPRDIYIILRVYNLQKVGSSPDFVAYVDPWTMFLDENLHFSAWDKFVVTASSRVTGSEG